MLQAPTLALALLVTAASANTLTDADVQGFRAFDEKAATMLQEIRDARMSSGLRPGECLQSLANQLTLVVSEFKFVETLAQVEQGSLAGDTQAKAALLLRADKFLSFLPQDRKAINTTMQYCAGNAVVAAKGQQVLRLCDEAGALVGAIGRKLGRAQRPVELTKPTAPVCAISINRRSSSGELHWP
jgi:hypothetical protein